MNYLSPFLHNLLQVSLDAAPWLLFGLIVAGLIKVLIPVKWLNRWLGGGGIMPVVNAALLGTPLPLCSCSVVPAALAIRRSGASRGATTSFLIATPENGADSLALSYALLGPVMMIARPVAAIVIAIATGFSVSLFAGDVDSGSQLDTSSNTDAKPSCCQSEKPKPQPEKKSCCCGDSNESSCSTDAKGIDWAGKVGEMYAAMKRLLDDIAFWLLIGLVLAALINTFVSQGQIASWGSGLPAMILMVLVGIPMYICATSSTPVAASMLVAGVSPGTVLVFLLAGPATNLGTVGIVRKELGNRTAMIYLAGVAIGSIAFGLGLDAMISQLNMGDVTEHIHEHGDMLPSWLTYGSMILLGAAMLSKFVSYWKQKLTKTSGAKSCCSESAPVKSEKSCCSHNDEKPAGSCCSPQSKEPSQTKCCCSSKHA